MPKMVEMIYNPYIPTLNLLINGEALSEYSSLIQFTEEDIWKWKKDILNILYLELREEFSITFTGTEADTQVFQAECETFPYCNCFRAKRFLINTSLQKRLGMLNQLIKKNSLSQFEITTINAMFDFMPGTEHLIQDVLGIEIENKFCRINISLNQNRIQDCKSENNYFFVIATSYAEGMKNVHNKLTKNPIYLLLLNEKKDCFEVLENCYIYYTAEENFMNILFKSFLSLPLVKALRNCVNSLSGYVSSDISNITAIDSLIHIDVKKVVEIGKSNPITVTYDFSNGDSPPIFFHVLNTNIAVTDNLCILGKSVGNTVLEAYRYGEKKPFLTFPIQVIKKNRIKNLILDEDQICIAIGDTRQLNVHYSPDNADNVKEIKWHSSNEQIASISMNGKLEGKSSGECRLICLAENVSAQCICVVRPYLEEIKVNIPSLSNGVLCMFPLQEIPLQLQFIPENSIDTEVKIHTSNYDIVNIVGGKLIAKKKGNATITITNVNKRKAVSFKVSVSSRQTSVLKTLFKKR